MISKKICKNRKPNCSRKSRSYKQNKRNNKTHNKRRMNKQNKSKKNIYGGAKLARRQGGGAGGQTKEDELRELLFYRDAVPFRFRPYGATPVYPEEMDGTYRAIRSMRSKASDKDVAYYYGLLRTLDKEHVDKILSIFKTVRDFITVEGNHNMPVVLYMLSLYARYGLEYEWINYLYSKSNEIVALNPGKCVFLKLIDCGGYSYDYFENEDNEELGDVEDNVFKIVDTEEEVYDDGYCMIIEVSMENGVSGKVLVHKEENIYNQIAVLLGIDPFKEFSQNKAVYPPGYNMDLLKRFTVTYEDGGDDINTNGTFGDAEIEDGARLAVTMRVLPTLADIIYDIDALNPKQDLVERLLSTGVYRPEKLPIHPDNPRRINTNYVNWGDLGIFLLPDSIRHLEVGENERTGRLILPVTENTPGGRRFLPLPESINDLKANIEYKVLSFIPRNDGTFVTRVPFRHEPPAGV